ncbi:DNA-processing protein DprA [Flavobacterium sp. ASW18X]|uniref:DNA-processing protein DprA n=1 Tax=Flavobacterium sp. ASW18X TaxID=2572595 RepID=UPI0010AE2F13|nr:DNA-processing protein DprA [Flavobacterium sp. ASW18X]TKD59029.1 DNA-processing protein DprA [Flavobacterium sp. ASW18X]
MIQQMNIPQGHIQPKREVPSYLSKGLDFKGNKELLQHPKKIAIIGSRKPTAKGEKAAKEIALTMIQNNCVIVSGLAEGIDTIAHTITLDNQGNTIAVIGTPIDKVYPKQNAALSQTIADKGLILSQFPLGTPVRPSNFPQRNKTMAYLCLATFICDATAKSGTRHQALEALKHHKSVYIMEHIIDAEVPWALKLLEKGAKKLTFDMISKLKP